MTNKYVDVQSKITSNSAFAQGNFTKIGHTRYGTTFIPGLYNNEYAITVGSYTQRFTYGKRRTTAAKLKATLIANRIYYDKPVMQVVLHVVDVHGNAPTELTRAVVVHVVNAQFGSETELGRCEGPASTFYFGIICIVSVSVPSSWFDQVGVIEAAITAEAHFEDEPRGGQGSVFLGPIALHGTLFSSSWNNIVAELPTYPLHNEETFDVPIYANFKYRLQTFIIDFAVEYGLNIVGFELAENGGWAGTQANIGSKATLACIRDPTTVNHEAIFQTNSGRGELLLTMRLRVQSTLSGQYGVRVQWNDTSDIFDDVVIPSNSSVIFYRNGVSKSGQGQVYVENNDLRGMFIKVDESELVNTAVISNQPIKTSVTVIGIDATGVLRRISSSDLTCTADDPNIYKVSCESIRLTGDEAYGSNGMGKKGGLTVIHSPTGLSATHHIRVWYPKFPLDIKSERYILRRVNGWKHYDGDDCSERFQESKVTCTTTFGIPLPTNNLQEVGVNAFTFEADVIDLVTITVVNPVVAKVIGKSVRGLSAGSTLVHLLNGNGTVIGSIRIEVNDKVPAYVSKLDVAVVTEIVAETGKVGAPFEPTHMEVEVYSEALTYEGAVAQIIVAAVFDDSSRMELASSDGVHLTSLDDEIISVVQPNDLYVEVPFMGRNGSGDLLSVRLESADAICQDNTSTVALASGILTVALPNALSVRIVVNGFDTRTIPPMLSPKMDPAHNAGVSATGTIQVFLVYSKREIDVTADSRTIYSILEGSELISFHDGIVTATGRGSGAVTIGVTFEHEMLETSILIQVVTFSELSLIATPWPSYTRSSKINLSLLSRIHTRSSTVYQQAMVATTMTLSNGIKLSGFTKDVNYFVASVGSPNMIAILNGTVLTPTKAGLVEVWSEFSRQKSPRVTIICSDAEVFVASIDHMRIMDVNKKREITTLHGASDQIAGYLRIGVTLSDGRQYPITMTSLTTSKLLQSFNLTSSVNTAVVINSDTGALKLIKNHPNEVIISLTARDSTGSMITRSVNVFCNLDLSVHGDVDLGFETRNPLPARSLGEEFMIPLRLHTANSFLGTFDIQVVFNPKILRANNVSFHENVLSRSTGILDSIIDDGTLHFSGSINKPVIKGVNEALVNLQFSAIGTGSSSISGWIDMLGDTSMPQNDIGIRGASFIAGNVIQVVSSNEERRNQKKKYQDAQPIILNSKRTNQNESTECIQEHGDTNFDCVFDINDVRFVTQYLAYRGIGFKGSKGSFIKSILKASPHSAEALDSDHNSEINGKDASFLNKVNLGIFGFVEDLKIKTTSAEDSGCLVHVSARFYGKGNVAISSVRRGLYFDFAHQDPAFNASFKNSKVVIGSLVTLDKGTAGGVIKAVPDSTDTSGTLYHVSFGTDFGFDFPHVGVSIIQTFYHTDGQSSVKVMSGSEKDPLLYATPFSAMWTAYESDPVHSAFNSRYGYNPLKTFTNTKSSIQCNTEPCLPYQYVSREASLITKTECSGVSTTFKSSTLPITRPSVIFGSYRSTQSTNTENLTTISDIMLQTTFMNHSIGYGSSKKFFTEGNVLALGCGASFVLIVVILVLIRRKRKRSFVQNVHLSAFQSFDNDSNFAVRHSTLKNVSRVIGISESSEPVTGVNVSNGSNELLTSMCPTIGVDLQGNPVYKSTSSRCILDLAPRTAARFAATETVTESEADIATETARIAARQAVADFEIALTEMEHEMSVLSVSEHQDACTESDPESGQTSRMQDSLYQFSRPYPEFKSSAVYGMAAACSQIESIHAQNRLYLGTKSEPFYSMPTASVTKEPEPIYHVTCPEFAKPTYEFTRSYPCVDNEPMYSMSAVSSTETNRMYELTGSYPSIHDEPMYSISTVSLTETDGPEERSETCTSPAYEKGSTLVWSPTPAKSLTDTNIIADSNGSTLVKENGQMSEVEIIEGSPVAAKPKLLPTYPLSTSAKGKSETLSESIKSRSSVILKQNGQSSELKRNKNTSVTFETIAKEPLSSDVLQHDDVPYMSLQDAQEIITDASLPNDHLKKVVAYKTLMAEAARLDALIADSDSN